MIVDTHLHLDAPALADEAALILDRARRQSVVSFITIGTSIESSRRAIACSVTHAGVFASVGLHPHEAKDAPADLEQALLAMTNDAHVVGVGETGLDYHHDFAPRDAQHAVFLVHVAVAKATGLPLVIHCREANDDVASLLERSGLTDVVMHCFTSDRPFARRCVDNGWRLAFGGAVTYPRNAELRAVVAEIPADRILFETDAPYMSPVPHRGKRNEPAYLPFTVACCAEVRETDATELAEQVSRNTFETFRRMHVTQHGEV